VAVFRDNNKRIANEQRRVDP